MSIAKTILEQPLDEDLRKELAHATTGLQERMTRNISSCLEPMARTGVGHVVMLINVQTGVVTIASNAGRETTVEALRNAADELEEGKKDDDQTLRPKIRL